jgi:hypothetical protein
MNQLAPDVSLVGEIALVNFQRANTQHIASGNHDFDFGMLKRLYVVVQLLKRALRISTSMYTNRRY